MPAFLAQVGATLLGVLMTMGAQLMTERFIKRLVVHGLSLVVKKTATEEDDKLLADVRQAWAVD